MARDLIDTEGEPSIYDVYREQQRRKTSTESTDTSSISVVPNSGTKTTVKDYTSQLGPGGSGWVGLPEDQRRKNEEGLERIRAVLGRHKK